MWFASTLILFGPGGYLAVGGRIRLNEIHVLQNVIVRLSGVTLLVGAVTTLTLISSIPQIIVVGAAFTAAYKLLEHVHV